jgi:hypothetical protein
MVAARSASSPELPLLANPAPEPASDVVPEEDDDEELDPAAPARFAATVPEPCL